MISNTKTAEWALHIAVLQSVVAELFAAQVSKLPADEAKALEERITAKSKAAVDEIVASLSKRDAKATLFGKELADCADKVIASTLAEMGASPAAPK
jgi:hypothetical protein